MSSAPASRINSKSLKDDLRKGSNWSAPEVDESILRDVIQKLEKLPQYATCGKSGKHKEALRLILAKEVKKCFSDYLHEKSSFMLVPQQEDLEIQNEGVSDVADTNAAEEIPIKAQRTLEETIVIEDENRETLIQRLSDFSVKIHITFENDAIQMALQVGHQVIEWTPQSIIKPHSKIPSESVFSIDLSDCLMKTLTLREIQPVQNPELDDRVLKLVRARSSLIEHVVKQIILFNRYYYYDATVRDGQNFIKNIMTTLKIDSPPHLSKALSSYVTELRNGHDILPAQDHVDLDSYVAEHVEDMNVGMMEYMALLYYQQHLDSRAKGNDSGTEAWRCPEEKCQFTNLLVYLNKHHDTR